jgi:hypothetical protein
MNFNINPDEFPTVWETFDSTAELILSLSEGCVAATFDISAAYPHNPSETRPTKLIVYILERPDIRRLSSHVWTELQCWCIWIQLVAIYQVANFGPFKKWVDDFFVIRLPHQSWSELDFMSLTADIGVPWSLAKLRPFASEQQYIEFDWDLISKSVSLPIYKLEVIQQLLSS